MLIFRESIPLCANLKTVILPLQTVTAGSKHWCLFPSKRRKSDLGLRFVIFSLQCLAGSPSCPVAWLRVPALPRGACVEWHFIALPSSPHTITCVSMVCVYIQVL